MNSVIDSGQCLYSPRELGSLPVEGIITFETSGTRQGLHLSRAVCTRICSCSLMSYAVVQRCSAEVPRVVTVVGKLQPGVPRVLASLCGDPMRLNG